MPELETRLRSALPDALKGRDAVAVAALRSALAAIANAEAVEVADAKAPLGDALFAGSSAGLGAAEAQRRELSDEDVAAIVRAEVSERRAGAEELEAAGRADRAERLRAEADVLAAHLG